MISGISLFSYIICTIFIFGYLIYLILTSHKKKRYRRHQTIESVQNSSSIRSDNEKYEIFKRNSQSRKAILISFYLLPKFREFILKYNDRNELFNILKYHFKKLQEEEINYAVNTEINRDITMKYPFRCFPRHSIMHEWKEYEKEDLSRSTENKIASNIEFFKLFCSKTTKNEFLYISLGRNIYSRSHLMKLVKKCEDKNCSFIFTNTKKHKIPLKELEMPPYFVVPYLMSFDTKIDDEDLEYGFLYEIYVAKHYKYKLKSFHQYKFFEHHYTTKSLYKSDNKIWREMNSGLPVCKETVLSVLSEPDCYYSLFYEKEK